VRALKRREATIDADGNLVVGFDRGVVECR
jgi:hypothetical protein